MTIDFFNKDDLRALLERIISDGEIGKIQNTGISITDIPPMTEEEKIFAEDDSKRLDDDESLYSINNFSI